MSRRASSVAAAAAAALLAGPPSVGAQISPGPLSGSHRALEGSAQCLKCHDRGKGVSAEKCLGCHVLLRDRVAARRGLHARPEYADCKSCHVEHQGAEADLVWWGKTGRAAFDHATTGYALAGAHARVTCEACHRERRRVAEAELRAGAASPARTFLGLPAACTGCHADPHHGQFAGRECTACHGLDAWRPAAAFDHSRARYPLTGRHAGVTCAKCHPADPADARRLKYSGIDFHECSACHRDPHSGRLGAGCASCHTTTGWKELDHARFDHSRTRYPLTGRHSGLACEKCHPVDRADPGRLKLTGIDFRECSACHRDPHSGRLGAGCASCHATAGWKSYDRARFDHSRTRYPLAGRHAVVACEKCHPAGKPLQAAFARCTDCHADAHLGQLRARGDGGACEACHSVDGFTPPRYSIEDHARARYPLEGAHRAVPCDGCHGSLGDAERRHAAASAGLERISATRFRIAGTRCVDCHRDPHPPRPDGKAAGCETCHRPSAWRDVAFDHSRTRFPLAGGHARVACARCHRAATAQAVTAPFALTALPLSCEGCHKDPHGGDLTRAGLASPCERCHTTGTWTPTLFDHDRDTRFVLRGAHARVACAACHKPDPARSGGIRYRPLPTDCKGCHAAPVTPKEAS